MMRCELTTHPRKRKSADQAVALIADNFPPGIAKPALRALAAANITRLGDLRNIGERQLTELHGMGPKALGILRRAMKAEGIKFSRKSALN